MDAEDRRLERLADPEQVDGPPVPRTIGDTHALAGELAGTTIEDVDDAAAVEAAGARARTEAAARYPDAREEDLVEASRQAEVRERLVQTGEAPRALPGDLDPAQVPEGYARDTGGTADPSDDVWVPVPAGATRIVEEGPGRRPRQVPAGYRDAPPGGADLDVAGEAAREGLPPLRRGLLDTARAELYEDVYTDTLARTGGDGRDARAEARAASDAMNIYDVDLDGEVAAARTSAATGARSAGVVAPEELEAVRDRAESQVRRQYPQLADDRPSIAGTTPADAVPEGWIADDGGTPDPTDDVYRPAPPRLGGAATELPGDTPAEDVPPGAVRQEGGPGPGDERWVVPGDGAAADLGVTGDDALEGLDPRRRALLITERGERYEDVIAGGGTSEEAQAASDELNAYGLDLNGQASGARVRAAIETRDRAAAEGRTATDAELAAARDTADDDLVAGWLGVPVTPRAGTRDAGGTARSLGGWEAVTVGVAGPDGRTDVDACGTGTGSCEVSAGRDGVGGATGATPPIGTPTHRAPVEARLVRPDGTVDTGSDDTGLGLVHDDTSGVFLGDHEGTGEVLDRDGRLTRSTAGGLIETAPGQPAAITGDGTGEVLGARGDGAAFDGSGSSGTGGGVSMVDSEAGGPAVVNGDGLASFRPVSADGTVAEVRGTSQTGATFVAGGEGGRDQLGTDRASGWFFRPQENRGAGGYGGDGASVAAASEDGVENPLELTFTGRGGGDNAEGDRFAVAGTGPAGREGLTTFLDRDDAAGGPLRFTTDDTGGWMFRFRDGEIVAGDDPGRLPSGRELSPAVVESAGWGGGRGLVVPPVQVDPSDPLPSGGVDLGAPRPGVPSYGSGPGYTAWGVAIDATNNRIRAIGTLSDAATRHARGAEWARRQLDRAPEVSRRALGAWADYERRLAERYTDLSRNLEASRDRTTGIFPGRVEDAVRRFEDFSARTAFDGFNRFTAEDPATGEARLVMGPRPLEFIRRGGTKVAGFGGVGLASVDVLYGLQQGESLPHSVGRAGSGLVVGTAGGAAVQTLGYRVVPVPAPAGAALGPYAAGIVAGFYVGDTWSRSGAAGRSGQTLDRAARAFRDGNPQQGLWLLGSGGATADRMFTGQVGRDLIGLARWQLDNGAWLTPIAPGLNR